MCFILVANLADGASLDGTPPYTGYDLESITDGRVDTCYLTTFQNPPWISLNMGRNYRLHHIILTGYGGRESELKFTLYMQHKA